MLVITILFITWPWFFVCLGGKIIKSPKIDIFSLNSTNNDTTEIHTICRITSDELIADAQSIVTRVSTKILDERFDLFEKKLNEIKDLVLQMNLQSLSVNLNDRKDKFIVKKNYEYLKTPRQFEIRKFNDTVNEILISNEYFKVYTYFWIIENMKNKLSNWRTGYSQRSNTFYIKQAGYGMYMKITPKYFPDGTIFIAVGLTKSHQDNKLSWPFILKLRIEILDHSPEELLRIDRSSRLWDPLTVCPTYFWQQPAIIGHPDNLECVGLSIPRDILHTGSKYLWNNSLYIKLIVYL
ncbi:hypothetical protein HCN44_004553 [Aphidius gifuensis]|uniref:MATH domain-containing protein n=1 Tax=Aphidius gifuensis TaxID=684658 RepID=A0A834XYB1_APHGI|nr:hypothetical protein HCN44_004553 [Aphidius gifuensis]